MDEGSAINETGRRLVTPEPHSEPSHCQGNERARSRTPASRRDRSHARASRRDRSRTRISRRDSSRASRRDSNRAIRRDRGRTRISRRRRDRSRTRSRDRSRARASRRDYSSTHAEKGERSRSRIGRRDCSHSSVDDRRARSNGERRARRSDSPIFSSKEFTQLINSIKGGFASQPPQNILSSKNLDYKNILPEFNPSTKNQKMLVWLKKVNECASVYGWDEKTTVHFAMQKLQGLAKTWYETLDTIKFTWEQWQEKLVEAFPCEMNYGQSLEEMLRRKSRFNESIETYYYEKLALLNQCEITGKKAVDCIIHGISDRTTKSSALALRCVEPVHLLRFLSSQTTSSQMLPRERNFNQFENKSNSRITSKFNQGVFCYNCKEKGHPYMKCPKPLIRCASCSKIGHNTDNCKEKSESTAQINNPLKTLRISNFNLNNKFVKEVCVNGKSLNAFIDLGSEATLIRQSDFAELNLIHNNIPTTLKGFGNSLVQAVGSARLNIDIDGVDAQVLCHIVDDHFLEKSMLIGQSYSEQAHIVVYKDANKLQFLDAGSEVRNICIDDEYQQVERVRFVRHSTIHGMASIQAACESNYSGKILINSKIVGSPFQQFTVCGGIYGVVNGFLYVTVAPSMVPCDLQKNRIFARAERVDVINRLVVEPTNSTQGLVSQDILQIDESEIKLGDSVSSEDKVRLLALLQRYQHCFAHDLKHLGSTHVTEMNIELNSDRSVVYRPYRLSHHEREKVRGMIKDMLEAEIIRESSSSYASPIILVRKKDGNTRLCVDYRMLNSITIKERYPMPIIEDEISRLSGQAWFITLDLMSGYYQVPISENSKHLTAFVTPDGHYEYNRMPFGLANAPAIFQRMMNHVLGPARFNKATVYIDDLLIFGKTSSECLDRLHEVLQLLQEANLKLNLSKCNFLQNSIDYLGYEISSTGMRPGDSKIRCVTNFPLPQNVHGVRQFIGLVSYFRKFIEGFALLANPLTKLLKKDATWTWSTEQDEAFNTLKQKLSVRPVLAIYCPAAETELHTDASRVGIGGILLQRPEGSLAPFQPVAFYSRQTTPEEKNFHSYELETLAVVCSLKKFRVYLIGKQFKIITDCSALRSTFQKRDLIPRIARWWLAIQEYDSVVEYRAGVRMSHVDALSRNPVEASDVQDPVRFPEVMAISEEDWLLTLQLGDPELRRIRDIVSTDLDSKGLDYIRNNYVIKDNKLFRCLDEEKSKLRWVVPKGARWQLCRMNHDDIGHVGFEKTYERIKKNYWFAKSRRFVKKYVESCIECAFAKKATNASCEGLLHPIPKIAVPFHTLHIDHLGPFVKSKKGFTHLLVAVDSFTKFVFIKPVRNTNAQNVINALDDIFYMFRSPGRIISDRGSCFTSHAFRRFCLDRGIKHILNAVASPRSNGQVERYNRTILDSLTAQNLKDDERNWDAKLGRIQWGLNNTVQKTIGKSPAEVMFGTAMDGDFSSVLNEVIDETRETCDLSLMRQEVKNRIDKRQEAQKLYYDKGRRPARTYANGDLVKLAKTAFQNEGKSTKLMPTYEGPYKVVKVLGNDRYKLAPIAGFEGMKNKRKTTVASDRLRPWINVSSFETNDDADDIVDDVTDNAVNDESDD